MLANTIPMPMPMGEEIEKTKIDMMAWQAPKLDWAMFRPETITLALGLGLAIFQTFPKQGRGSSFVFEASY